MKAIFFTILIFLQVSCSSHYFTRINKTLDADYPAKSNKTIKSASEVRRKIFELGFLSFITEKDTIFFLNNYDLPSATHYGSIWTLNKSFHYSFSKGIVTELLKTPIENDITSLISKWDTTDIKKESEINYNRLNPNHTITAYRVCSSQKGIITDKIIFKPFYK